MNSTSHPSAAVTAQNPKVVTFGEVARTMAFFKITESQFDSLPSFCRGRMVDAAQDRFALDVRELGTVLAALRCYQDHSDHAETFADIATDGGKFPALSRVEIDGLCERLNGGQDSRAALLDLLEQCRAALPDAWAAHRDGVPRKLIERLNTTLKEHGRP